MQGIRTKGQLITRLELALEREKKERLDMDKQRRKAETNLKISQEQVADLERSKKELSV